MTQRHPTALGIPARARFAALAAAGPLAHALTAAACAVATAAILAHAGVAAAQGRSGPGPGPDAWSVRMARSVMTRSPVLPSKWDYTHGLVLDAIERVGERTRDAAMLAYVQRNVDRLVGPDGAIADYDPEELSLDQIEEGKVLLSLYERTRDRRYRTAAAFVRGQLARQPRTSEGGFWHKKIYPQQMWLDGVYMASPFATRYARTLAVDSAAGPGYGEAATQVLLAARHLRDPRTGLYWHGWDAARTQIWADPKTGVSPNFWGRALGWYAMAVVDVLGDLPATQPQRPAILRLFRELAGAIARVQDPPTGLWYQVLDQPNRNGNYLEASASSMFVYALARGVRLGYLPPGDLEVAQRGFAGLVAHMVTQNSDGTWSLNGICAVAGLGGKQQRNGSFEYYVGEPVVANDFKGVGPFIMAALELDQ